MKTTFLQQLWIAFKIWLFALTANTLLGTMFLTNFFTNTSIIENIVGFGIMFGAIFSFPVMIILLIIINRCIAANTSGLFLFRTVLICGIVLSVIVFKIFQRMMDESSFDWNILLCIAILSGIAGISTQYKSLLMAGYEFHNTNIEQL